MHEKRRQDTLTLYHGSNTNIDKIDLTKCKPYKDFGKGFYLTALKVQAERMALRVSCMFGGIPYVNIYSFDDSQFGLTELRIRRFEKPSEEWAKFVITNRNYKRIQNIQDDNNIDNRYDIVIGPIANDDLALLFRQFSDDLITVETLVKEMEFKKLTDQYSFHTERALSYLTKTGADNV